VYGITWLQVYLYYTQHSSNDRPFLKCFVAILTALDTLHVALLSHGLYIVSVTNFGNYLANLHAPWSIVAQVAIGVFVTTCIQLFYAFKIFQLSERRNIHIPFAICVLSVAEFGLGIAFTVKSFQIGEFDRNTPSVPYGASSLALEVICGVFITSSMVYYILKQRSGVKRSNRVLNLVVLYIINSGALNLIFAVACLTTYVKYPKTLIYAPFFFILIRLYSCSFMTILNSRVHLRSKLRGAEGRTLITVSQERVTDRGPVTTSMPRTDSNGDILAMVSGSEVKRLTAERAVGLDEAILFKAEDRPHDSPT